MFKIILIKNKNYEYTLLVSFHLNVLNTDPSVSKATSSHKLNSFDIFEYKSSLPLKLLKSVNRNKINL